ncbi:thymidylate synthase [Coxiella burnetii]|uniref:Thymidylate synthase n=4 Tax=Coxiella burnetii TaxID=777 RepID=TYSY_COXBU|nr:thymidylate synthase [Coxiella burnetii]NP_820530.1 thymidylate synthase [Coxiella burnetii RSA 493]A9KF61.1 RecName: Full=Thymidylate synthase; Short=TS; Short=TSase [Coxiella burnetii Dugway 5J108-111]A9N980.1 RecName: Full=Thymidylate synthase; Short=TS; Short=TSase [Coxiella burnetii RSA 331]Q83BG2.1 RecName: Full=Thymidylate synthase; Short=TS; Short=TSase [Coxiella burnetii RSA 493]AAO91044.1 thymidylate synthase [Coxiella burnetii RSA 493]ABX79121.1 thymidylate synthase [Coxiella bu
MKEYLNFLQFILDHGVAKTDRTGIGTKSVFGYEMRFNLREGFPLVTTKKIHLKSVIYELLWFLRGDTNIQFLNDNGVTIWDEWADENGDLGPIYGKQWRRWHCPDGRTVDQMQRLIREIKTNPDSRRLIVSAWNVGELDQMALPPCHLLFQFYVADGFLSCKLTQRSADAFLGVPFNIASYSLLTHLIARQCNLKAGEFIWSGGDCHIYNTHQDQVSTQLSREPRALPQLIINRDPSSLYDYNFNDFSIVNYHPHPAIKAPVAV